jgi:hypothetical protein
MTGEYDARTGNGMSMADDNTMRSYRPNDPLRRDTAPASERERSNDPLVELARLIGQSDPFAEVGRGNARDADVRRDLRHDDPASPPVPDWRGSPPPYALMRAKVAASAPAFQPAVPAPASDHAGDHASDYADDHRYAPRFAPEPQYDEADRSVAQYDAATYDDTNYAAAAQDGPEHEFSQYDADAGAAAEQQDEAIYDDPPRARRRGGMLTALTLIGCAMIGTAGAYGYRTYYVSPAPYSAPVIVADKTPTKVVPASDAQSSKVIQDRVGDAAPAERMVTREEQPVVLKVPTPPAVLPAAAVPFASANTASIESLSAPPPVVTMAAPPAAAAPPSSVTASGEPKRIRTVTIRADGSEAAGNRPVTATSSVSRAVAPAPKAAAARGGPLQLDPQQLTEPAAPAPGAPLTPTAPRVASAPATGGSGGYVVQVSSQKSESEAQASFHAMQAKYPSAFNGRSPIIRRADLGAKGVFYRALVGPFASSGDAGHFCSSLKAAGGQCIVQKN